MKVLFDTNILVDYLCDRQPHSEPAARLLSLVEARQVTGVMCATTVTTLYYLQTKILGGREAKRRLRIFLNLFEVAPVNHVILLSALDTETADYEDAVICEAAVAVRCEAVITRDPHGFVHSPIRIVSPGQMLEMMGQGGKV